MPFDCFAHAVYGVEVAEPDASELTGFALTRLQQMDAAVDGRLDEFDQEFEFGDPPERPTAAETEAWDDLTTSERQDAAVAWAMAQLPEVAARVRAGLPADAFLFWVEDEDEHPGQSATSPGTLLAGYGLYGFPRAVDPAFAAKARWHTWVTGG